MGLTAPSPHPLRYYACLCGHEELVLYLLANGECRVGGGRIPAPP